MSGLGFDCTTVPGFVGFEAPACPTGQVAYTVSSTNECPVFGCMPNFTSINPVTDLVTHDPLSPLMTINEIEADISMLQSYVAQGVTASNNNLAIVGAADLDPQTEINYLQGLLNAAPLGLPGTASLNPYSAPSNSLPYIGSTPITEISGNSTSVNSTQTNNGTSAVNTTPPNQQTNVTNTSQTNTSQTDGSSGVETFSFISGEPTIAIGNYDIGVYTGLAALAVVVGLLLYEERGDNVRHK